MREGNYQWTYGSSNVDFDFGKSSCRLILTADEEFTFGHYCIDHVLLRRQGNATIGGVRYGDRLYYGVSLCSPEDNFSKKIGRTNVVNNLIDGENSSKRGVFSILSVDLHLQPALLLKWALEDFLGKAKRLPPWTRGEVSFRKTPRRRVIKKSSTSAIPRAAARAAATVQKVAPEAKMVVTPAVKTVTILPSKRSLAALKAWETRRKKNDRDKYLARLALESCLNIPDNLV
jgi:hypothetical protein